MTYLVVANDRAQGNRAHAKLGIATRPLTPEEKQEAAVVPSLVVEQVSSPLARTGVKEGMGS
jgi:hypothetical protein